MSSKKSLSKIGEKIKRIKTNRFHFAGLADNHKKIPNIFAL